MNITDWFYDVMPYQRKRTLDWVLPAVAGVGIGLAAGIGIGLLCAPSTGEEARLRLREGASRVKDRAASLAAKARSQIAGAERSTASSTEQLGLGHS
jgi:gas vesicle protein